MPGKWVILHGGALGDLVLTLHLALQLVRVTRDARLHVISRVDPGDLSACTPAISRQSGESAGVSWLYGDSVSPPAGLHATIHDANVLNALSDTDSSVHARLAALSPRRLYSFDPRPRAGLTRHVTRQWQTDLEAQGLLFPKCIHQRPARATLQTPATLRDRGRELLAARNPERPLALLHPGSGGKRKCWPLANYARVAELLAAQEVETAFVLGPVEAEWWDAATLAQLRATHRVISQPTPNDLLALLAGAHVYVGNDSGPTHLAALLGTPTVALFGPTDPAIWHPLGRKTQIIAGDAREDPESWGLAPATIAQAIAHAASQ